MKIKSRIISLMLAGLLCVCALMVGCAKKETVTEDERIPAGTTDVEENTDVSEEETEPEINEAPPTEEDVEVEEEIEEEPPKVLYKNPLTGLACKEELINKRPVAMMINNIKQAIPQLGISNADIMYECIVEGGITRLMCVFLDYENLPVTGSVRSSRDYYIDIAQSHDAIYAHCGGSEDAYSTIAERRIDNIDGVRGSYAASSAYWKDQDRVRNMGYEHASMTNGENIAKAIANLNYRTTISENFTQPISFHPEETPFSGEGARSITISYSGSYSRSFFDYDEETGVYKKGQYGQAHIDANTNEAVTFENIIVLGVNYRDTGDSYHHLVMTFAGEGKGYYAANGVIKEIVWKKPDRQTPYALYETDGVTPLLLNPGKSYIGLSNGLSQVKYSPTDDYTIE